MKAFAIAAVAACSLVAPAAAAQEAAPLAKVYACAGIVDAGRRLTCYDETVGGLKRAEDAGDIAAVTRADIETFEKDVFGLAAPSLPALVDKSAGKPPRARIDLLPVSIVSRREGADGKGVIVTDTGQVWRQIEREQLRLSGKGPWTAEIRRGAVGNFFLKVGNGTAVRVKRQQ